MAARLNSIDVLRAIAACSVVLYHSDGRFILGAAGVDLFFVISGFIIAGVATHRPASAFLRDRIVRIFPLYWIALLPWIVSASAFGTLTPTQLVLDLLLIPRIVIDYAPLLILSWTLVFELLFYLGAAISTSIGSPKPVLALLTISIGGWALTGSPHLAWVGNPMMLEFLFGVLIFRFRNALRHGPIILACGIALLFAAPDISGFDSPFHEAIARVFAWGIPAAMIVYGGVSLEARLASPWLQPLRWLGVASYSIYLFHPLATALVPGPWWLKLVAGVGTGAAAWLIFERNVEIIRRQMRSGATLGKQMMRIILSMKRDWKLR